MKLLSSKLSIQVSEIFDHSWNYKNPEVKTQIQRIVSEINFFYCSPIIAIMKNGDMTTLSMSLFSFSSVPDFKQPFNLSVVFTEPNLNF